MARVIAVVRKLRPNIVDPWTLALVIGAFGLGVLLLSWHGSSLRLEVEAANVGWAVLVGFGMTYHGDWDASWRVAAGLLLGAASALGALYGAMSLLPVTAMGIGIAFGVTAAAVAAITHLFPRIFSFAAAAVGFGVGVAAGRAFPLRPTTPLDDLFAVLLTVSLAIVVGAFGSIALRSAIVWIGMRAPGNIGNIRFRRRRELEAAPTIEQPPVPALASPTSKRVRPARAAAPAAKERSGR